MMSGFIFYIKQLSKQIKALLWVGKEEKLTFICSLILCAMLNILPIARYANEFTQVSSSYCSLFINTFHISGFDPLTYAVISSWDTYYNVYRHPLLAFFFYPFSMLNQLLIIVTDRNCTLFIMSLLQVLFASYSFVLLFRIQRQIIGTSILDASLLTALFFSFAYIMLTCIVPDHFLFSMTFLLLALYISGKHIKNGKPLPLVTTIILFIITAGISLSNGVKIFLAALFSRRKRFFYPKYLLFAVVLPAMLLWFFARYEYRTFVWPKEMARKQAKLLKKHSADNLPIAKFNDTTKISSMAQKVCAKPHILNKQRKKQQIKTTYNKRLKNKTTPLMQGEFMRWTDISTPRCASIIENFFGESIQLHKQHLLEDIFRTRPVIVNYTSNINYVVEAIILLLFIAGCVCGAKSRFLWFSLSFFFFDVFLHIVLGFGINEVYIMSAHWLFVIPLAIGFLLKRNINFISMMFRVGIIFLILFLLANNISLLVKYFL